MKSHTSLSILETWPLPFSSAQGTLLLPLTTLQSERIVSLFLFLELLSFQGVFFLLSPSLPPLPWVDLNFLCFFFFFLRCVFFFFSLPGSAAAPPGCEEWLAGELGRAPALQREGNNGEGPSTLGPPTASHGRLHRHATRKTDFSHTKKNLQAAIIIQTLDLLSDDVNQILRTLSALVKLKCATLGLSKQAPCGDRRAIFGPHDKGTNFQ